MSNGDRMWEPSPSPEEAWSDASGGANENGEWSVDIVGEEIRLDGTSRYEVKWHNWQRRDGSNTTWEKEPFQNPGLIGAWKRTQRRFRNSLAEESLDMEVPWLDDAIHKRLTNNRRQAYDEKLEKRNRTGSSSTANWDAEIEVAYMRVQAPERGESSVMPLRVRPVNQTSIAGSSVGASALSMPTSMGKRTPSTSSVLSSRDQPISAAPAPKRARARPRINSTPSTPPQSAALTPSKQKRKIASTPRSAEPSRGSGEEKANLPSVVIPPPTLRGRISLRWGKAAQDAKAASIRISPDIADENIPRNLRKFNYMEQGYFFREEDGLKELFSVPTGVFMIYDLRDKMDFSAYSEGLYTFQVPRGVDVVECNKHCGCDDDCGNRVVQRPRTVPLEIFDTQQCGWGVRALENIPQGKVLGTYTGMLVPRDKVDELPQEHYGYMFDLDSTEIRDSENPGGKYTVDCYERGNWTRFVNHSCSPNLEVFCVVYDTIPDVNMPYVAFAASMAIPAGTELTIDYHPYAEEDKKGKRRASGRECRCGSDECRGWL